ncbi:MAG: hypothetical protein AAF663_01425 [Planctomycetota bacterium]
MTVSLVFSVVSVLACKAQPQVLMTVNIADPDAVIFSATGASPAITDSGSTSFDGVSLINLFRADFDQNPPFGGRQFGDLQATGGRPYLFLINDFQGLTQRDLNLHGRSSEATTQTFTTDAPAFSGSMVLNLSTTGLYTLGAVGEIQVGDSGAGPVLGQFEVINRPFGDGDYNADGFVDQGDLNLVLNNWGFDTFNGNETPTGWFWQLPRSLVAQEELNAVLNNWGSSSGPNFAGFDVPEPAGLGALAGFALCGLRRRGRAAI